jgi:hypothetical protein
MKIRLQIRKAHASLYESVHDVTDAESFGSAFSDAWVNLRERRLTEATSVGALMEMLNQDVLDELVGAEIRILKAS